MILTDAELESTPLLEENICNGCRSCADACPLGAIGKEETEEIDSNSADVDSAETAEDENLSLPFDEEETE